MAALTTTNVQRSYFGDLKVTYGEWTATEGDAPATLTIEGGKIYFHSFASHDASGTFQTPPRISVSGTSGVITVTVYAIGETVTAGTFLIIHK
jgi:hypothetical protein